MQYARRGHPSLGLWHNTTNAARRTQRMKSSHKSAADFRDLDRRGKYEHARLAHTSHEWQILQGTELLSDGG